MIQLLFSYGTPQRPEVQRATFGRELTGHRDAIVGYHLDYVTISDAHVDGTVFAISETELAAADAYEVDDYRRIEVPLRSGPTAWVYVFAG
ncbi:gamma-glutamylcyclotransferase family protein [Mycobacterium colombiense]